MPSLSAPRLLVLRRDSATGMTKVGWDADMPLGRFEHIASVCETRHDLPLKHTHTDYVAYCDACDRARHLNDNVITRQINIYRQRGWIPVPLDLNCEEQPWGADEFGNYYENAIRALFRLTANHPQVWAVFEHDALIALYSRQPPRPMNTLEYQVWKHSRLSAHQQHGNSIRDGTLLAAESGLWLVPS